MNKEILEGNKLIAEYIGGVNSTYFNGSKSWIINTPELITNAVTGDETRLRFHKDWSWIMPVVKRIVNSYFDNRSEIYEALNNCDIEKLFKAVVDFIKFWNDETQKKLTWKNQPQWAVDFINKQKTIGQ